MKKRFNNFGWGAQSLVIVSGKSAFYLKLLVCLLLLASACKDDKPDPGMVVAADFDVSGLSQTADGNPKKVTITPKEGKSGGAVTIYYEGADGTSYTKATQAPAAAGKYAVTFDVAATTGWNAATGLAAGTLQINDGNEGGISVAPNINRYHVEPYTAGSLSSDDDRIQFAYRFGDEDYYYIYLGRITNTPLYSFSHQGHTSGVESTYSVSRSKQNEESISRSVAESVSKSREITREKSVTNSHTASLQVEVGANTPFVQVKVTAGYEFSHEVTQTSGESLSQTRSVENTETKAYSIVIGSTEERTFNLNKDAPAGYYRYSLFHQSDVYLYIVVNRAKPTGQLVYYEFIEHIRPSQPFWDLDYCPTGDFAKKDPANVFDVDMDLVKALATGPRPSIVLAPVPIEPRISAGAGHSLAIDAQGRLWVWGNNARSQLGNGSYGTSITTPQQLTADGGKVTRFKAASGNQSYIPGYSLAIDADGKLWAWGEYGLWLGLGSGLSDPETQIPRKVDDRRYKTVSAGSKYTLAIDEDGRLWGWGENKSGQLTNMVSGQGTDVPQVIGTRTYRAVSAGLNFTLAIDTDGNLWTWGSNNNGCLGNDGVTGQNYSEPQLILSGTKFTAVSAGSSHSLAIDEQGNLWAFGRHYFEGKTTRVPIQVGNNKYMAIGAGSGHSLALDVAGHLWIWGKNEFGQIGNGVASTTIVKEPMQVGNSVYKTIASGVYHNMAVDNAVGLLFTWGDNSTGQLGDGTTTNGSRPKQIMNLGKY